MTILTKVVLSVVLIGALHGTLSAKGWRGLVPLHSTKKDVVRLFRQCSDAGQFCNLKLKKEYVFIDFSDSLTNSPEDCGNHLPADTILSITVSPVKSIRVKDLHLNAQLYERIGPSPWGYIYLNESEGVILSAQKGRVVQVSYVPVAAERGQCPLYYSQIEDFVSLDPHGPVLYVDCPPRQVEAGKVITFFATSVNNPQIWFSWRVNGARIIEGQGTDRISVATDGLEGRKITATVVMRILRGGHIQEGSCETEIISRQQ